MWAVDVNERARALCAANAEAAGLANVRVAAPDEVPADVRFAGIWSNPPIRIGKAALHELLLTLARPPRRRRAGVPRGPEAPRLRLARPLARPSEGHPTSELRVAGRLPDPRGRWSRRMSGRQLDGTGLKRLHRDWRRRTDGRVALLLDGVASTYNVGSILRTAAAERVEHLWFTADGHAARRRRASPRRRWAPSATSPGPSAAPAPSASAEIQAAGWTRRRRRAHRRRRAAPRARPGRRARLPGHRPRGPRPRPGHPRRPATPSASSPSSAGSARSTSPPPPPSPSTKPGGRSGPPGSSVAGRAMARRPSNSSSTIETDDEIRDYLRGMMTALPRQARGHRRAGRVAPRATTTSTAPGSPFDGDTQCGTARTFPVDAAPARRRRGARVVPHPGHRPAHPHPAGPPHAGSCRPSSRPPSTPARSRRCCRRRVADLRAVRVRPVLTEWVEWEVDVHRAEVLGEPFGQCELVDHGGARQGRPRWCSPAPAGRPTRAASTARRRAPPGSPAPSRSPDDEPDKTHGRGSSTATTPADPDGFVHVRRQGDVGRHAAHEHARRWRTWLYLSPVAERELWRYLVDVDLVAHGEWHGDPSSSVRPPRARQRPGARQVGRWDHIWARHPRRARCPDRPVLPRGRPARPRGRRPVPRPWRAASPSTPRPTAPRASRPPTPPTSPCRSAPSAPPGWAAPTSAPWPPPAPSTSTPRRRRPPGDAPQLAPAALVPHRLLTPPNRGQLRALGDVCPGSSEPGGVDLDPRSLGRALDEGEVVGEGFGGRRPGPARWPRRRRGPRRRRRRGRRPPTRRHRRRRPGRRRRTAGAEVAAPLGLVGVSRPGSPSCDGPHHRVLGEAGLEQQPAAAPPVADHPGWPGPAAPSPARRRGSGGRAAPGRGRGTRRRRPRPAGRRCSTASVPMAMRADGSSSAAEEPVTSTTGSPASASSSSRSPGDAQAQVLEAARPRRRRTPRGRSGRRSGRSELGVARAAATAAPQRSQSATWPHAVHASSRDRPDAVEDAHHPPVGSAAGRPAARRRGPPRRLLRRAGRPPRRWASRRARSTRAAARRRRRPAAPPARRASAPARPACTAPRPGGPARRRRRGRATWAPARTGAPRRARRARATERRAASGIGAHTATRVPTTDAVPRRGAGRSRSARTSPASSATRWPSRRSRSASRRRGSTPGHDDDGRTRRDGLEDQRQAVRRRRPCAGPPRRPGDHASPAVPAARACARWTGGDAARRRWTQRPAQRHAAHSARSTDLRRRALRGHLGQRLELAPGRPPRPASSASSTTQPPHPAAVQLDADQGPDAHLVPEQRPGPGSRRPGRPPAGPGGPGRSPAFGELRAQSPRADLRSSTRVACSQVKSFSSRPKCP